MVHPLCQTHPRFATVRLVDCGAALKGLEECGLHPPLRHLANSGAVSARPNTWHNFVRPGLSLYGYEQPVYRDGFLMNDAPSLPLKPVLAWKTHILGLRDVPAGQPLGYNGAYTTPSPARIAVVSVGYGDGLSRKVSIHAGDPVPSLDDDPAVGRGDKVMKAFA